MMHFILISLQIVAAVGIIASALYYLLCLWSASAFLRENRRLNPPPAEASLAQFLPSISILKPLKGIDPGIYEGFRSHCAQDYPKYEIIFGVSDPSDAAIVSVKALQIEFPQCEIKLIVCPEILGANVKVSNLAQMVAQARYEYLIVNDSDIRVQPNYLRRVVAPLAASHGGMVTCLYRGVAAGTPGSRLEALGISTDFCAGVLVARQLEGGLHFGLGSTLAFRRAELAKIGGFDSIVNHLADDYELGKRIADLGLSVELSDVVVETNLPAYRWKDFFSHQLRWARGVRDSRGGGHFGLLFTFGIFWALTAVAASGAALWSSIALGVTLCLRFAMAFYVGWRVLRDRQIFRYAWMIPLRDLIAVLVWAVSLWGNTVVWRGERFHLKEGKLIRVAR